MIEPLRAPVRPRVRKQPSGEVVLLEEVVAELLAAGGARVLVLSGEVGAGTTIAAQHLAETFSGKVGLRFEEPTWLVESPDKNQLWLSPNEDQPWLVLIHTEQPHFTSLVKYRLEGWERDEWIEYLLSVHHDRCASVMRRIQADAESDALGDNPGLWRQVLDELAADEALTTIRSALQRVVLKMFPDRATRLSVGRRSFEAMTPGQHSDQRPRQTRKTSIEVLVEKHPLVSKQAVLVILAAEAIIQEFENGDPRESLRRHWPRRLVHDVSQFVAKSQPVQDRLRKLLAARHREVHPLAASLRHVSSTGWKPDPPRLLGIKTGRLNLAGAFLAEADWPEVDLTRCDLSRAIFTRANLEHAQLGDATACGADFASANLQRVFLSRVNASDANFVGANLSSARGGKVILESANLSSADLTEARLLGSNLKSSNLKQAILRHACLASSDFHNANTDVDFYLVDLRDALYDLKQRAHFQKCGAILESRTRDD